MKILTRAISVSDASTVEFIYVELTPEMAELLRERADYIREVVETDEQFVRMSFWERSPDLVFRLQDDLRPFAVSLDRRPFFARLPDETVFSPNTEKEACDVGVLRIHGRGFSWRLKPKTARYDVESGLLPWSILEEV